MSKDLAKLVEDELSPIDWIFEEIEGLLYVTAKDRSTGRIQNSESGVAIKDMWAIIELLIEKSLIPGDTYTLPSGKKYFIMNPNERFRA